MTGNASYNACPSKGIHIAVAVPLGLLFAFLPLTVAGGILALAGTLAMPAAAADSERGAIIFESQGCIQCHGVRDGEGRTGPELGRRIGRGYTPAALASTIWNHAPTMWQAMANSAIEIKPLSREDAADLIAFFSSSRFFDRPADGGRGRRAFASNHCAECHGIDQSRAAGAPPVSAWRSLADPLTLTESMWNHAARMRSEFAGPGWAWPVLKGQDLSDILIYLRHLPSIKAPDTLLHSNSPDAGKSLFESKGCIKCHTGTLDLKIRLHGKTLTDIAAAMWNHAPQMAEANLQFAPGEMRTVVSYLWTESVNDDLGNARRGARVFKEKRCAECHQREAGSAPSLDKIRSQKYSPLTMISAVWSHGPAMQQQMKAKQIKWPRFDGDDMADLISFLNSGRPARP